MNKQKKSIKEYINFINDCVEQIHSNFNIKFHYNRYFDKYEFFNDVNNRLNAINSHIFLEYDSPVKSNFDYRINKEGYVYMCLHVSNINNENLLDKEKYEGIIKKLSKEGNKKFILSLYAIDDDDYYKKNIIELLLCFTKKIYTISESCDMIFYSIENGKLIYFNGITDIVYNASFLLDFDELIIINRNNEIIEILKIFINLDSKIKYIYHDNKVIPIYKYTTINKEYDNEIKDNLYKIGYVSKNKNKDDIQKNIEIDEKYFPYP